MNIILKSTTSKIMKAHVPPCRTGSSPVQAVRLGAVIASVLLLSGGVPSPANAAAPSSTFRFALPGGAAIIYGKALNPQAPLPERAWQQAIFHFPSGATFSLLPRTGAADSGGTKMEPPSNGNISPSGQYVVIGRIESGSVSSGPGQPESDASREYCAVVEIRTGCITADQTGEICGAGWQAGQRAQWGTDEQTSLMLKDERPSTIRLLQFIGAGQPPWSLINDASGTDNLLRCDPPSSVNRDAYHKIAKALHAAGADNSARLIDAANSKADDSTIGMSAPVVVETTHRTAIVSVQQATLYTAPDDAHASRAYLVQNDAATVLNQSPAGWTYVDYVNVSGRHLLRWIKSNQLAMRRDVIR